MLAVTRFVPNPRFPAEATRSAPMRAAMLAQAEVVKAEAERIGREVKLPWIPRKGAGGSFVIAQQGATTAVVLTDHLGHLVEFGWSRSGPRAPLRRAARAAGLTLK
jgi:hypothetical protein